MSTDLMYQLFVVRERFAGGSGLRLLQAILSVGFAFEPRCGQGGRRWIQEQLNWRDGVGLDEILEAVETDRHWGMELYKTLIDGASIDLTFTIERGQDGPHAPFVRISLATWMSATQEDVQLSQQFLSWALLLANLATPFYGWGGSSAGLFASTPVGGEALLDLAPPPLEWLNIYGAAYVERIGLTRLLSAPAWRVEFLAAGSVALTLAPHPYRAATAGRDVARHLGLPGPGP